MARNDRWNDFELLRGIERVLESRGTSLEEQAQRRRAHVERMKRLGPQLRVAMSEMEVSVAHPDRRGS